MVGILGGGVSHVRLPTGRHVVIDNLSTAPKAARADMYEPMSDGAASARDTRNRRNAIGASAVAVPGSLAGWTHMLARYGTQPLHAVMRPAIRLAEGGFTVTSYLSECIGGMAGDLAGDAGLARLFLRDGKKIPAGSHLVQAEYAATLRRLSDEGPDLLYRGSLGAIVADHLQENGGAVSVDDLATFVPIERAPVATEYRGKAVIGPPPPASGGVHIAQMLNILEGFDIGGMGFGSPDSIHLLAEVLKIAFADRAATTADPAFVKVPVERLISKAYASERRANIDLARARRWSPGRPQRGRILGYHARDGRRRERLRCIGDSHHQRPVRRLRPDSGNGDDREQLHAQLRSASGPRAFDRAGQARLHLDGADDGDRGRPVRLALGLPGGLRIFPSAFQAIVNWIDHGMASQEAVEAPRIWTEGGALELEPAYSDETAEALEQRGHTIQRDDACCGRHECHLVRAATAS